MRPLAIVELSVFFYHLPCLAMIVKEVSVKTLISELAFETRKVSILPGTAFFRELMAYAVFLQKLLKSFASEFRTLIASDDSGYAKRSGCILSELQ